MTGIEMMMVLFFFINILLFNPAASLIPLPFQNLEIDTPYLHSAFIVYLSISLYLFFKIVDSSRRWFYSDGVDVLLLVDEFSFFFFTFVVFVWCER